MKKKMISCDQARDMLQCDDWNILEHIQQKALTAYTKDLVKIERHRVFADKIWVENVRENIMPSADYPVKSIYSVDECLYGRDEVEFLKGRTPPPHIELSRKNWPVKRREAIKDRLYAYLLKLEGKTTNEIIQEISEGKEKDESWARKLVREGRIIFNEMKNYQDKL